MSYTKQNFADGNVLTAEHLNNMENALLSKWHGKKISVLGDSILYGVGLSDRVKENITTLLQNMTGATVTNYGISGTKVSGNANNAFHARFPDVSKGADLTIVFGGIKQLILAIFLLQIQTHSVEQLIISSIIIAIIIRPVSFYLYSHLVRHTKEIVAKQIMVMALLVSSEMQ